jgi:hypothetical protein
MVLEDREKKILFARKVLIHRALADARLGGDLRHPRGRVALAREDVGRRFDELGSPAVLVGCPGCHENLLEFLTDRSVRNSRRTLRGVIRAVKRWVRVRAPTPVRGRDGC